MTNQTETNPKKQPAYIIYQVKKTDDDKKAEWLNVGATWENSDGEGFNLILDIFGQKIPLTMRKFKPK